MIHKLGNLFVLKNGFEAGLVIYALAWGAASRGAAYLDEFPGNFGWVLFAACMLTVLIAGASLVDGVKTWRERRLAKSALGRVVARARAAH